MPKSTDHLCGENFSGCIHHFTFHSWHLSKRTNAKISWHLKKLKSRHRRKEKRTEIEWERETARQRKIVGSSVEKEFLLFFKLFVRCKFFSNLILCSSAFQFANTNNMANFFPFTAEYRVAVAVRMDFNVSKSVFLLPPASFDSIVCPNTTTQFVGWFYFRHFSNSFSFFSPNDTDFE